MPNNRGWKKKIQVTNQIKGDTEGTLKVKGRKRKKKKIEYKKGDRGSPPMFTLKNQQDMKCERKKMTKKIGNSQGGGIGEAEGGGGKMR